MLFSSQFTASCDDDTKDVLYQNNCYFLDGSAASCVKGSLADQDLLSNIASSFVGKNYKTTQSNNCCIYSSSFATKGMEWGFNSPQCNAAGPFTIAPVMGGAGCDGDTFSPNSAQLTFCFYTP